MLQRLNNIHVLIFIVLAVGFVIYLPYPRSITEYIASLIYPGKTKRVIVAFGDSLTEGLFDWPKSRQFHPYTIKLQERINEQVNKSKTKLEIIVKNYGVSGERLANTMKTRLQAVVAKTRPDLVIILGGTNDLLDMDKGGEDVMDRILNDLQTLHLFCQYKGIKTVALSIPETSFDVWKPDGNMSRIRKKLNRDFRDFVKESLRESVYVDIANEIPRKGNADLWDDGVHLSPKGYDRVGEMIFHGITKQVEQWLEKT